MPGLSKNYIQPEGDYQLTLEVYSFGPHHSGMDPDSYNRRGSILHRQRHLEAFLDMPKASWATHDGSPRSIRDRAEFTSYLPCTSAALYVPLVAGLQGKDRLLTSEMAPTQSMVGYEDTHFSIS